MSNQQINIKEFMDESWRSFMHDRPWKPHNYVYASGGVPCDRQIVLEMVAGDQRLPWTADKLANFQRGKDREEQIKRDMREIGRMSRPRYSLENDQQRFEIKDSKDRVVIVGKVEGFILFETGQKIPYEIKSWSQNIAARIRTFDDLMLSRWTQPAITQILSYLHASKSPQGLLILDRHGLPEHIPVEMTERNQEKVDGFIKRASDALDHVAAKTLPDFIKDFGECKICSFFGIGCQPDTTSRATKMVNDEELLEMLRQREALKESHSEYESLDKIVKKQVHGIEAAVCGEFMIEGKEGFRKEYTVKATTTWTSKITRM